MSPVIAAFSALLAAFQVRPVVIVQATGAPTPVTQIIVAQTTDTFTDSTTEYMTPASGSSALDTSEGTHEIIVLAGTVSELRVQLSGSVGPSGTAAFTMRKCTAGGGACSDTALNCTVATGTSVCDDTSDSVSVANGDRLTISVATGNVSNSVLSTLTWKWVGTNSNESMLISSYNADNGTTTECGTTSGGYGNAVACTSITGMALPAPENFTITGLWARSHVDIATGCRRIRPYGVFNGSGPAASSTFQVDLSTGVQEANDQTGTLTLNTGSSPDYVAIEDDPGDTCGSTGTATTSGISYTMRLTSTSQRFMAGVCAVGAAPSTTETQYTWPIGGTFGTWNATQANRDAIANGFTQTGVAFRGDQDPDPGNFTYRLRNATTDKLGCTVSTGATSCNASGSETIADGDMIVSASVPAGSPDPAPANWCFAWSGSGS